jgi:hypothetical protein
MILLLFKATTKHGPPPCILYTSNANQAAMFKAEMMM